MSTALVEAEWIWMDGEFIRWHDAKIHVLSLAVQFGSSVFEGIRCYGTPQGPAIFRLHDHLVRLFNSCRVFRMLPQRSLDELTEACRAAVHRNALEDCYIRPMVLRGYGAAGMNPVGSPVHVVVPAWPWGTYLGAEALEQGVDVCVSSWQRAEPNTFPSAAKAAGNYNNAQLIKQEAVVNGYAEAIALSPGGLVSEGSGQNLFVVRDGTLISPTVDGTLLSGITRDTIITLAGEMAIPVREQPVPRETLYMADEMFFTGTASEVTPIRSVDRIPIGSGRAGSVTKRLQARYMDLVRGRTPDTRRWLTSIGRAAQAVAAILLMAGGSGSRMEAAAQQPASPHRRAVASADWYRLTTVAAPTLSPDGTLVAFTVTTLNEKENRRHNEVWTVPADGGEPERYTSPTTESSAPRFSPDGKLLLFTSRRAGAKTTTWSLRVDRPSGEAAAADSSAPVGSIPRDRRFVVWSDSVTPDTTVADSVSRPDDPWAKMMAMARPPFGAVTRPVNAARFDGRQIVDLRYKTNDRGFIPGPRSARVWRPIQIWMQPVDGHGKRQVTSTSYSHFGAVVSPDGRWIAFTADTALRADSTVEAERDSIARLPYDSARDERVRNDVDIFVIPTFGCDATSQCRPRRVTHAPGTETALAWSPDGMRIGYIARPAQTKSARIFTVSSSGGPPNNLLGDWRYEPEHFVWLADGSISFSASVGGRTALFKLNPTTKAVREVLGGRRRLSSFAYDAKRARVVYVASGITTPPEIYTAAIDGTREHRLTHFNDQLNSEIAWSDAERFTYPSVGGLQIEGWLMKPYGYVSGRKYPLVLYIHGGPHAAYGESWFDEFQNLAAERTWVLFTNPRGSAGYGADFTYATRGRWGGGDYEDLMKAVDIAAQRPGVDSTRMGVSGGSYGGYMTAWITTRTTRFKAAETDRMISDWTYWYGASDAQGLTEFEFYGKPWDNFALYDTLSPIRHVARVKTPTLIVQSEDDFRTPMGNAELWFMALKKQGVPVELIRYPRSTHELSRSGEPWLLVDRLGRIRQWFAHWLRGADDTTAERVTTPAAHSDRPNR